MSSTYKLQMQCLRIYTSIRMHVYYMSRSNMRNELTLGPAGASMVSATSRPRCLRRGFAHLRSLMGHGKIN